MYRWITRGIASAVLVLAAQTTASAQTLFFNGQWDRVDGQTSGSNVFSPSADQIIFENFVVSGSGWNVTGVFGEFLTEGPPDRWLTANWQIRSGISAGNAGTLVASGVGPTTSSLTGIDQGSYYGIRSTVSGLNVMLTAGTYWLALAPIGLTGVADPKSDIYLGSTSGLNGVNALIDGDFFVKSTNFNAYNYVEPAAGEFSWTGRNFALGVLGTQITSNPPANDPAPPANTTVPEPSTYVLMATGLAALGLVARRRRVSA
jgi:hypothetical protein